MYAIYLALAHLVDVIDCGDVAIFIDQDDGGIGGPASNIQVIEILAGDGIGFNIFGPGPGYIDLPPFLSQGLSVP